jgi:site-specific DNA-cytosine methylase
MRHKRSAERTELDAHAARMRQVRARLAAAALAGPRPRRVVKMAQFAAGLGGALVALAALSPLASFADTDFRSVFACDIDAGKLRLYDAMAASMTPPSPPGVLADVTDAAFFTAERVAAWGSPLDLIVSSIPCTSLSSLGKRDGLKSKTVNAFVAGLLRILALAMAPIVVLECTRGLETDKRFCAALVKPLRAMGYSLAWHTLDARHWVGAARLRLYVVCMLSAEACEAFAFPSPPPCREVRLQSCILPAFVPSSARAAPLKKKASASATASASAARRLPSKPTAPANSYFVVKVQQRKLAAALLDAQRVGRAALTPKQRAAALAVADSELALAAQAVAKLPFLRGRKTSRVVTFHFDRVTQIEKTYGVAPTLTKSGAYLLRDAFGVRTLTGGECARLHGYPPRVVAAYEAAASSGQLVAAVGDSFVIGVVRDVLKMALKARAAALEAAAAEGGGSKEAGGAEE